MNCFDRFAFCHLYLLNLALVAVLFLTGCNGIQEDKQNNNDDPKSGMIEANNQDLQQQESQDYSFESKSIEDNFPKDTCGDSLPQERRSYPVEFYPVYIEHSEENLKRVKSNFCQDAFVKDVDGSKVIQVASFAEKTGMFDPGYELMQLLKNEFKVYKGQSKVIPQNPHLKQNNNLNTPVTDLSESIHKSANLNQKQVDQLLSMPQIKLRKLIGDSEEVIKFTLGVLVPTYLPDGFRIDEFNVSDNSYYIFYQNSNNQCFVLEGFPVPAIGDEPTGFDMVEAQSPILGRVALEYTDTDWIDGSSYVGNPGPYFTSGNFHAYTFKSPGSRLFNSPKYEQKCNSISVQEAVNVVESLRYLNP